MMWNDIACIVFVTVTMNHLGLISAIEEFFGTELPIVNCVKCSTWWMVLFYMLLSSQGMILSLAVSFFCSYSAIWLELFEGYLDTLYRKCYDKIYSE